MNRANDMIVHSAKMSIRGEVAARSFTSIPSWLESAVFGTPIHQWGGLVAAASSEAGTLRSALNELIDHCVDISRQLQGFLAALVLEGLLRRCASGKS